MGKPIIIEFIAQDGASKVIRGLSTDLHGLDSAGKAAGDGSRSASGGLATIGDASSDTGGRVAGLIGQVQKLSGAFALIGTAQQVVSFTDQGTAVVSMADSFDKLTASAKVNGDTLLQSMKTASNGYISDIELMKGANKALLTGGSELAGALPKLLQIAGASAKATGGDMKQLYQDLIEGITKAEPEILDNLGITLNLTQVYDGYAQTLGKTANQLTTTEKSAALLNAVMAQGDSFIQKLGGSANAVGGSIAQLRAGFENLKTTIQGLSAVGLEQALSGGTYAINETNRMVLEAGASYARYREILAMTGQESDGLSQAQYTLAQSLMASGQSALDASTAAHSLSDIEDNLGTVFQRNSELAALSAAQQSALTDQVLTLAAASPEAAEAIRQLTDDVDFGRITSEEYTAILRGMEVQQEYNTSGTTGYADAQIMANDTIIDGIGIVDEFAAAVQAETDSLYAKVDASIIASIEQENLAYMTNAARVAASDHIGMLAAESGSLYDVAAAAKTAGDMLAYKALMASAAQLPRNTTAGRNDLRADGIDPRNAGAYKDDVAGRAQDIVNPQAARDRQRNADTRERERQRANAEEDRATERANRPTRGGGGSRGGGGGGRTGGGSRGGGGGGGKSDAERAAEKEDKAIEKIEKNRIKEAEKQAKDLEKIKTKLLKEAEQFAAKMQKIDADHVAKERKIWDDYYAKELAAYKKFNGDKFKDQLSFRDSLKGMDAQARASMLAEERKAWSEAQAIAQAGNPKLADEYYKFKTEQIQANQQRADEVAAIDKEITEAESEEQRARLEAERQYLLALDAEHDTYDAEDIEKLKAKGNEIEQERDAQLSEEETRYAEAQNTLKDEYAKSVDEIVASAGTLQAAAAAMRDELVSAFATIGDAASAAASAASSAARAAGGGGGDAAAPAPAPDGSHADGLGRVPRDGYIAELHKNEEVLRADDPRNQNNRLRDSGGVRSNQSGGTITNQWTIAPNFSNSTAPRADVRAAAEDMRRIIRDELANVGVSATILSRTR